MTTYVKVIDNANALPTTVNNGGEYWIPLGGGGGAGTVTNFSFTDGSGFDGTVINSSTTPTLSLQTTVSGIIKGSGGALTAATAGTDYANLTFKTIAVSGQSDIVADSAADTLTIAAGANITLTTNAGTDTLTIASTGGTPGGSDTQVQFNDAGSFGGDSFFTWNKSTNILYLGSEGDTGKLSGPDAITTDTAGGALTLQTGAGDGTGTGGTFTLFGGVGGDMGNGGRFQFIAGDGGASGGNGGGIDFQAGNSHLANGGSLNGFGGSAQTDGSGGSIQLISGNGAGTGAGGDLYAVSGDGGDTGKGGLLQISGGAGGITSGDGGEIIIESGGASDVGNGGQLTLSSGEGGVTSGDGGNLLFTSGDADGGGNGGTFQFKAGIGSGGGVNGTMVFDQEDGNFIFRFHSSSTDGTLNFGGLSGNQTFSWPDTSGNVVVNTNGIGICQTIYKSMDQTINNSDVLQDDTALVIPVLANEVWAFYLYARWNSNATADFQAKWSVPGGTTMSYYQDDFINEEQTESSGWSWDLGGAANIVFSFEGTIFAGGTPGNVVLQWAQNVADASDTTMLAGSYIIAYRLA